jgi:2-(1,2-epoxy-1,2-dihydrophenyl)acetyl-CoA isomerase
VTSPEAAVPVVTSRDGAVVTVALNRPERLNAVDAPTRANLLRALQEAADDESVRVVVLTGSGRAFCVGQDLGAVHELEDAHQTVAATYNPIVGLISSMPKPVIAAVNGLAVGAGFGFALACDLRYAAESAGFAASFVKVGLVPDSSVSWHLVRELGRARAIELASSGRSLPAAEAHALGLVNDVFPDADLPERVAALAAELARGPALALALTKRIFVAVGQESFDAVAQLEALSQGLAAGSPDHLEGRTAFSERRPPRYRGAPA